MKITTMKMKTKIILATFSLALGAAFGLPAGRKPPRHPTTIPLPSTARSSKERSAEPTQNQSSGIPKQ